MTCMSSNAVDNLNDDTMMLGNDDADDDDDNVNFFYLKETVFCIYKFVILLYAAI